MPNLFCMYEFVKNSLTSVGLPLVPPIFWSGDKANFAVFLVRDFPLLVLLVARGATHCLRLSALSFAFGRTFGRAPHAELSRAPGEVDTPMEVIGSALL